MGIILAAALGFIAYKAYKQHTQAQGSSSPSSVPATSAAIGEGVVAGEPGPTQQGFDIRNVAVFGYGVLPYKIPASNVGGSGSSGGGSSSTGGSIPGSIRSTIPTAIL